ncbi:MAG: DUF3570 domain-containing protein [Sandaracinaceae bacterium]|nr:DUF3570 domain-containing protein [Sandaracinaceae bacterium]
MRLQLGSGGGVPTPLALALLCLAAPAAAQPETRVAVDALYYTDTDNVMAFTPSVSARHRFEDGGSVGARGALDVITAASVDVVSHATNRFDEARTEGAIDFAVPIDDALFRMAYRASWEPDYLSNGLSAGLQLRLGSADSVLDVSYGLTWDVVGRTHTPWSSFSEDLFTHALSLSLTQNLGPETVLRLVYSPTIQDGYLEKPYRYVPLFDDTGQQLASRVPENVPDLRHGHAFGARLLQYLEPIDGSLRVDYQLYVDGWGVTGHVVEAVGLASASDGLRFGLRGRFYGQTAASFWQRQYTVPPGQLPRWRTLDRDLSPYVSVTGAARLEWNVDDVSGYLDGAATYTRFLDFLLLDERVAIVTQIGFRWTPR